MVEVGWLRSLGTDGLTRLLERRPEGCRAPVPRALSELAERLVEPAAVLAVLRRLELPAVQVVEVLAALGGVDVDRAEVARLLGPARSADVDRILGDLADLGVLAGGAVLTLVEPARYAFGGPLGLGPPAGELLAALTAEDLRVLARNLGVRPPSRKAEVLAVVAGTLRDADRVRSVLAGAPADVRELLDDVARTGRPVEQLLYFSLRTSRVTRPEHWARARGLLLPAGPWSDVLAMPAEVGLALRGPEWTAPFDPDPPAVGRVQVEQAAVDREAAAAGGSVLRAVTGLLGAAGRDPVAVLRAGGIGVRELRRLARLLGCESGEVRLALSVAYAAGLLVLAEDGAAPSDRSDEWLAAEPPERLAALLAAWWTLPYVPSADLDAAWHPADEEAVPLRAAVLAEAGRELGAVAGDLAALVRWRRPYGLGAADPRARLEATWAEAAVLGAAGAGCVSTAGQALLRDEFGALPAALAAVGAAVDTVTLQADLTAVVAGTPTARLAAVLDSAADRETSGVASVWRFDGRSVRRALDAGQTPQELEAALTEVAPAGMPQPLAYLIRDAGRRHGRIRAQAAACCLRSDDEALLAEAAADRMLRALGLRLVAPTVLLAERPLAETLATLRAAGYAPLAEHADGTPVWERQATRRGAVRAARRGGPRQSSAPAPDRSAPAEPRQLAGTLLARADNAIPAVSATLVAVKRGAPRLTAGEARLLAHAVDTGTPVRIDYLSSTGSTTSRIIDELELDHGAIEAWCRLRDDQRRFTLNGILAVAPA